LGTGIHVTQQESDFEHQVWSCAYAYGYFANNRENAK